MKFDITGAVNAKESGKFLSPGIKEATFEGIEFTNSQDKDGKPYQAMSVKFTIDGYGSYSQNFFEPTSDERKDNPWGGKNASPADDLLILVREILESISPETLEQINDGTLRLQGKGKFGGTFRELVLALVEVTRGHIGTRVQLKMLPNNKGYAAIPTFIAKITSKGELTIKSWVIGHDLTLDDYEKRRIDTAAAAQPTNMTDPGVVQNMKDDLDSDTDLPF